MQTLLNLLITSTQSMLAVPIAISGFFYGMALDTKRPYIVFLTSSTLFWFGFILAYFVGDFLHLQTILPGSKEGWEGFLRKICYWYVYYIIYSTPICLTLGCLVFYIKRLAGSPEKAL